jgi:penicillin-binding protein 2
MKYIQKDIRLRNIGSYKNGSLDKDVVTGKDITLTIDYDLQRTAEEMLVNKHGAIVAIDPNNGEVLVAATGRILIRIFLPDLINLKTLCPFKRYAL